MLDPGEFRVECGKLLGRRPPARQEFCCRPSFDVLGGSDLLSAGTFEVFVEVNAEAGHYAGYVKPFFRDLKFKAVPDPEKNLVQRAATKVAGAVTDILKNKQGQVATKAPFEGDFADNNVDLLTTIDNLFRNAFVQSLQEGLEGHRPTG